MGLATEFTATLPFLRDLSSKMPGQKDAETRSAIASSGESGPSTSTKCSAIVLAKECTCCAASFGGSSLELRRKAHTSNLSKALFHGFKYLKSGSYLAFGPQASLGTRQSDLGGSDLHLPRSSMGPKPAVRLKGRIGLVEECAGDAGSEESLAQLRPPSMCCPVANPIAS